MISDRAPGALGKTHYLLAPIIYAFMGSARLNGALSEVTTSNILNRS
jgi:hypothetical protein